MPNISIILATLTTFTTMGQTENKQVKPWFYNLPPAGLAGVNPRGCAEKFIKAQY